MSAAQSDRFDRQLRLWGSGGQEKVEAAFLLALGCDAIIAETLESLCAAGLSRFCLVSSEAAEDDNHSNLFSYFTREGESDLMGLVLLEHLKQLSPTVQGIFIPMDESAFVNRLVSGMSTLPLVPGGTLIILATKKIESQMEKLHEYCADKWCTQSITIFSQGPFVLTRPRVSPALVINSHLPRHDSDLLLNAPPPALTSLAGLTFESMKKQYSHDDPRPRSIPYVLILLNLRERFIKEHDRLPTNSKSDRLKFSEWLEDAEMTSLLEEECLVEARENLFRVLEAYEIPSGLKALMRSEIKLPPPQRLAVDAITRFIDKTGRHPMSGKIDDMISDTKSYLELKEVYARQASEDFAILTESVSDAEAMAILNEVRSAWAQLDVFRPEKNTSAELAAHFLDIAMMEKSSEEGLAEEGSLALDFAYAKNDSPSIVSTAVALLAATSASIDQAHQQIVTSLCAKCPDLKDVLQDTRALTHLKQCAAIETIPSVAGILGGMLSAEIIKMTTQQFIPSNHMLVYDGVTSRCVTLPIVESFD